jgi:hypothetical protein
MKQKISRRDLETLLMEEVRKNPECQSVHGVAITRPVQESPNHPNWGHAWSMNTLPISAAALQIGNDFQSRYDVDWRD